MKKTYVLLTICCALMACKKVDVDFSYSPTEPKAGETVKFSNLSSSGEEWEWAFGDGSTSTLKAPSHIYKKPGTYRVSLKVDNKKSLMCAKELTVFDTVPTFVCEDSVFRIYQDYTLVANVYNPYNYDIEYQWYWPVDPTVYTEPRFRVIDDEWTNSTLKLYFLREGQASIGLKLIFNGDTIRIVKTFDVLSKQTNSILLRNAECDWRQRIFGARAEDARPDGTATKLLDAEQDTVQTYNGYEFRLSEIAEIFPEVQGFHIANRKIYFRAGGLWVANIDGTNQVQIDATPCVAMILDTYDNRIYWANEQGVWYMPFIGSDNNKFVTTPTLLNSLTDVTKLAADNEPS
ncbi:MAG: PKD domain-containing protein [Paludibacteraceae bacterium]|nr:PKD domain-containing protein [Paludibacteraceae bacterium]